jgi:predicted ATPase
MQPLKHFFTRMQTFGYKIQTGFKTNAVRTKIQREQSHRWRDNRRNPSYQIMGAKMFQLVPSHPSC